MGRFTKIKSQLVAVLVPEQPVRFAGLFALLVGAFALDIWNNDFPIYYHADERVKIEAILTGVFQFKHPILMLRLNELAGWIYGVSDPDAVLMMARNVSALFGVRLLLASFLLAHPSNSALLCPARGHGSGTVTGDEKNSCILQQNLFKPNRLWTLRN